MPVTVFHFDAPEKGEVIVQAPTPEVYVRLDRAVRAGLSAYRDQLGDATDEEVAELGTPLVSVIESHTDGCTTSANGACSCGLRQRQARATLVGQSAEWLADPRNREEIQRLQRLAAGATWEGPPS